jgi:hypothetical protein
VRGDCRRPSAARSVHLAGPYAGRVVPAASKAEQIWPDDQPGKPGNALLLWALTGPGELWFQVCRLTEYLLRPDKDPVRRLHGDFAAPSCLCVLIKSLNAKIAEWADGPNDHQHEREDHQPGS